MHINCKSRWLLEEVKRYLICYHYGYKYNLGVIWYPNYVGNITF